MKNRRVDEEEEHQTLDRHFRHYGSSSSRSMHFFQNETKKSTLIFLINENALEVVTYLLNKSLIYFSYPMSFSCALFKL